MTITVLPAPIHNLIGPGILLTLASDFIGPIPNGSFFVLDYSIPPSLQDTFLQEIWPTNTPGITLRPYTVRLNINSVGLFQPVTGDAVHVNATLNEPTGQIDLGQGNGTWDATAGLGFQILELSGQSAGGLTPGQALQLEQTHSASFPSVLVDNLVVEEITSGPQSGTVGAFLPKAIFGVLVRIANVPPELKPETPDADYWFPSLAVIRMFLSTSIWQRIPVHTSNKLYSPVTNDIVGGVPLTVTTSWPQNMSVQVSFRVGVTGQVFLLHFP